MEVLADGRAPNPVITPRRIVGASIRRPGTWLAISSSPTLLRVPDFSSVMPRDSPARLSHTLTIAGRTHLQRHLDVVDNHQPIQCAGRDVSAVDEPVQPRQQT